MISGRLLQTCRLAEMHLLHYKVLRKMRNRAGELGVGGWGGQLT